ncbi:unnamed protein product [Angiostrongylus costaricensis]|uniref:Uncharacterized protein n=1 Tax=Angiostrongylus costaricensis TaxID=334426 RepID=A0A0R3PIQ5_ANGCS|nr:unnamed protein product [Angiostrongylus costaricensis]
MVVLFRNRDLLRVLFIYMEQWSRQAFFWAAKVSDNVSCWLKLNGIKPVDASHWNDDNAELLPFSSTGRGAEAGRHIKLMNCLIQHFNFCP